jgi:site-specific DNA recombinase
MEQVVRAATYARNSTDEQRERQTIDRQRSIFRDFLARYPHYVLVESYEDEGVSGTVDFDQRPAGQKLLADLRAGMFSVVLVTSLDRFGRTLQTIVEGYRAIERIGGTLYVMDSPLGVIDTTNPMGKFAFHLLAIVAELERDLIRERTVSMRRLRAREGRFPGGRIPYGYRLVNGRIEIAEDEAEVVRSIARMRLSGLSFAQIARDLNERGIPYRRKWADGHVDEYPWTDLRVSTTVRRDFMSGERKYGDVIQPVPPILDRKTLDILQRPARRGRPPVAERGLLSGLLRCAECGGRFYSHLTRRRKIGWERRYYLCENVRNVNKGSVYSRYRFLKPTSCNAKIIPVDWLDALVLEQVEQALREPERWVGLFRNREGARTEREQALREELERAVAELERAKIEYDRLLGLYTGGRIDYRAFDRTEPGMRRRVTEAEERVRSIEREIDAVRNERGEEEEVLRYLAEARETWNNLDPDARKEVARHFIRGGAVRTIGKGRDKQAVIDIEFWFGAGVSVRDEVVQKDNSVNTEHGFWTDGLFAQIVVPSRHDRSRKAKSVRRPRTFEAETVNESS